MKSWSEYEEYNISNDPQKLLELNVEMNKLALDYNNAVQKSLGASIPNNINSTVSELQVLTQDERWHSFVVF